MGCPECKEGLSRRTNKRGRRVHTVAYMKGFGDVKVLCSGDSDLDGNPL